MLLSWAEVEEGEEKVPSIPGPNREFPVTVTTSVAAPNTSRFLHSHLVTLTQPSKANPSQTTPEALRLAPAAPTPVVHTLESTSLIHTFSALASLRFIQAN